MKSKKYSLILLLLLSAFVASAQYNMNAYMIKAKKCVAEDRFEEAIKLLNICLEAQPGNCEVYYYRGGCKYFLNDYLGAEQDFTNALASFSSVYYESFQYRSQVRYRLGNFAGSVTDLNKVIEKQKEDPKLYLMRAFSRLALNDFEGALCDCKLSSIYKYVGEDLSLCKGTAEYALGEYENALVDYFKTLSLNATSTDALVRRGMAHFKLKNYCEAGADYDKAISLDSNCTFAYYNRAELESTLNNSKAAILDFSKVLMIEPRNAAVYFSRATVYANTGRFKVAIADFDKVLLINPGSIQAAFNRGKLKQEIKEYKGALADYDLVLSLYPYFMEAYYNKSKIKYLLNDPVGAKNDFNTGKVMSQVLHSKSDLQIHRDSLYLAKLNDLNGGFNGAANIVADTIPLGIRPMYTLIEKEAGGMPLLYSSITEQFNKSNHHKFGFAPMDSVNVSLQEGNAGETDGYLSSTSYEDLLAIIVKKSNSSLVNDAAEHLSRLILLDTLCPMGYFIRAINTFREAELVNSIETPFYVSNAATGNIESSKSKGYHAAIADFSKVIELAPKSEYAYFNRAYVRGLLNDFNGAVSDYEKAAQLNPGFAEAIYNEAILLYYLNYKEQACAAFSKAGELGVKASYSMIKKYCGDLQK